MVPSLFGPWAEYLVERANPHRGARVLDVACGTGIVARTAARRVGPQGMVAGLDISSEMIAVARASAERDGISIEWRTGRAERVPFPDEHFDLVLCQFGLMFFKNRIAALQEMHRVLKTGGRVFLSVWQGLERHPFYETMHEISQRRLGKSSVETVFSLGDPDEVRDLLLDSGFRQVQIDSASMKARFPRPQEFLAWEIDVDPATTPALRDLNPEAQQAVLAEVRRELQAPLDAITEDHQAVVEFHARFAEAGR